MTYVKNKESIEAIADVVESVASTLVGMEFDARKRALRRCAKRLRRIGLLGNAPSVEPLGEPGGGHSAGGAPARKGRPKLPPVDIETPLTKQSVISAPSGMTVRRITFK